VALCLVGAAVWGVVGPFSAPSRVPAAAVERGERSTAREPPSDQKEAAVGAVPPDREPEPEAAPAPASTDAPSVGEPTSEWPPSRAFTARCKAPGGGCVEQCTVLAGGRCLDPCFIHTAGCSTDCLKQDGTCGWPPPDAE
jgi:hypothetical protein